MSSSDIALILRWLVPLWLLGWAVWPVSRRLFSFLPDQGLAAGRLLALVAASLGAFFLGSIHVLPVSVGACLILGLAIWGATRWQHDDSKAAARQHKATLVLSDCVFVLAFAFFTWVRLRHPSINDLEKPMDLMLLGQAARSPFLPFEHLWFEGVQFTNYYYFGPFMGGMLARLLFTSPPYAYNLVQPLFCALFLSVLWSLGAALSKSKWLGLGVMALVGLGGHLEPLRQLHEGTPFGELNWWKTSRVIPSLSVYPPTDPNSYTINEYPAFTTLIGDTHAHFYALSLAALHFCVCLGIVCVESARARALLIGGGAVLLGVFALTNTWDVPVYGLLWLLSIIYARKKHPEEKQILPAVGVGLALSLVFILPFFARFRSQVGGGGFELWIPDLYSFSLFWGAWMWLGALAFGFGLGKIAPSREGDFRRMLLGVGLVSLLFPSIYFLGGAFSGGELKHMDTVFKFYLQAWLLGGTAIGSEFLLRLRTWSRRSGPALSVPAWAAVGALALVLSLAPYATLRTRVKDMQEEGLSLDGAKWLPQSDKKALEWLGTQTGVLAEQIPPDRGGDYLPQWGTFATHSGLPTVLCWPGHVRGWGFQDEATREAARQAASSGATQQAMTDSVNRQVDERINDLLAIFSPDANARRDAVKKYGISFIVVRPGQQMIVDPNFESHEFDGDDGSKTYILARRGF